MRFLPLTPEDRRLMLARIGARHIDELFARIAWRCAHGHAVGRVPRHAEPAVIGLHLVVRFVRRERFPILGAGLAAHAAGRAGGPEEVAFVTVFGEVGA